MKRVFVLAILDGWGLGQFDEINTIYAAKTSAMAYIQSNFPSGALQASGIAVGLPWEETGNSEVGHLTLGAGKILYQHLPRISLAIQDKTFFSNEALKEACAHVNAHASSLHIAGLLTKNTVHASLLHLKALLELAHAEKCKTVYLHLFTDGKDGGPREAPVLFPELEEILKKYPAVTLASVMGRYYAMSRDENWGRTQKAYEFLTEGTIAAKTWKEIIEKTYSRGLSDEFVEPSFIDVPRQIQNNDTVIFFNFREDGIRQLATAFAGKNFSEFPKKALNKLFVVTMTTYDESLEAHVAFPKEMVTNPLGKVLADNGKNQLRIAETEKYAHVTYFFNGLKQEAFPNEFRVLIPSQKIVRYEEHPEMQAAAITDRALLALHGQEFDFILLNYANPDVIAHTGNYNATVQAIRTLDEEIKRLAQATLEGNHLLFMTADHGNAEAVMDLQTGKAETKHNPNPVPCYLIAKEFQLKTPRETLYRPRNIGILSDVAPTLLTLMNIPKPKEMTGQNLLDELLY